MKMNRAPDVPGARLFYETAHPTVSPCGGRGGCRSTKIDNGGQEVRNVYAVCGQYGGGDSL